MSLLHLVPAVPVREELDDMIHIEEVRKAVKQMKCNKASGGDGIPAEVCIFVSVSVLHYISFHNGYHVHIFLLIPFRLLKLVDF